MKAAAARPIVVLALAAAAWSQAPAANAAQGGHQAAHQPSTRAGVHLTADGHTETFSQTDTDLAGGGVEVYSYTRVFDNHGLLVHSTRLSTIDGVVVERTEEALTYGQANRLSQVVTVDDQDGDGPLPASTRVDTLNRNSRHLLVSVTSTIDDDSDGVIDSTETEARTFDARGRKVTSRIVSGDTATLESIVYDSHGNVLSDTVDTDDLSTPQSPDSRTVDTSAYNAHDIVTSAGHQELTFDAQGGSTLVRASHTTYTSDKQNGPITKIVATYDNDGDGQVDETAVDNSTYDKQGNPLTSSFRDDNGTDVYTASQVFTNDAKGRAVEIDSREALNGTLMDTLSTHYTYDSLGRIVQTVDTWDHDGDGVTDEVDTQKASYDHQDRVISADIRFTDGNGVLLSTDTISTSYGKSTSTETQLIDSDGDGVVDRRIVTVTPL